MQRLSPLSVPSNPKHPHRCPSAAAPDTSLQPQQPAPRPHCLPRFWPLLVPAADCALCRVTIFGSVTLPLCGCLRCLPPCLARADFGHWLPLTPACRPMNTNPLAPLPSALPCACRCRSQAARAAAVGSSGRPRPASATCPDPQQEASFRCCKRLCNFVCGHRHVAKAVMQHCRGQPQSARLHCHKPAIVGCPCLGNPVRSGPRFPQSPPLRWSPTAPACDAANPCQYRACRMCVLTCVY